MHIMIWRFLILGVVLVTAVPSSTWHDLAALFPINYNGENGIVGEARLLSGGIEPLTERINSYPASDWTVNPFGYRAVRSYKYLIVQKVNSTTVGTHPAGTNNAPEADACVNLNAYSISQIKGTAYNQGSGSLKMYILAGNLKVWEKTLNARNKFAFDQTIISGSANTVSLCANAYGADSVDHAEWVGVQFFAPPLSPTVIPINVRAWIDGKDLLHIKYDGISTKISWQHQTTGSKPGYYSTSSTDLTTPNPTQVNGYAWTPTWSSSLKRNVTDTSNSLDLGSALGTNLGSGWLQWTLTEFPQPNPSSSIRANFVKIVGPLPSSSDWELLIQFDDTGSGAAWRDITAAILVPVTCASQLPNYCPFPKNVKDTIVWERTSCTGDCLTDCCQPAPDEACYDQYPGWRHDTVPTRTTTQPDAGDCCQDCFLHKSPSPIDCKYWTFHETTKECTLHSTANLLPAGAGWTCSIYQKNPVPANQCGDVLANWQYNGIETIFPQGLPAADESLCCQLCTETQGCVHWTWKPANGGLCFLHNATADIHDMSNDNDGGYCSYSSPVADPSICGALVLHGYIHDTDTIVPEEEVPDLPSCCDLCKNTAGCHYLSFVKPRRRSNELRPVGVCRLHSESHLVQDRPGSVATYPHPQTLPSECAPIIHDWKYEGSQIHMMHAPVSSSCCAYCAEHPQCMYWTWNPRDKHCHIFSSITHTERLRGAISGSYTRPEPASGNHPPKKCYGKWIEVDGTCSMPCGTGKKREMYHVSAPAKYGGENCEAQPGVDRFVDCNRKSCGNDCVGKWVGGTRCSKFCGWGTTSLEYHVIRSAQSGGHQCEHHDHKIITKPCYVRRCGPGESSLASEQFPSSYAEQQPSGSNPPRASHSEFYYNPDPDHPSGYGNHEAQP